MKDRLGSVKYPLIVVDIEVVINVVMLIGGVVISWEEIVLFKRLPPLKCRSSAQFHWQSVQDIATRALLYK